MLIRILCLLLLVQACAPSLPVKKDKAMDLPPSFPESVKSAPEEASSAEIPWKDFFQDPKLNGMIDTALNGNQEINILQQEIDIANNEIMARQGEYLPKVTANASGGLEKTERFDTKGASEPLKFGRAGLMSTWEIDIWKKLRNASKAAYMSYLGSVEGRRFAVTLLVSEVANTYYELMALDNQLELVDSYVEILKKITHFVSLQQQAGRVTSLPVKRFEAEALKNQARQYELKQQIVMTQNKLNALLGRFPQKVQRNSKDFLTMTLSHLNSSVPSKILDYRPDVRQAGFELEAAKLSVDVARARFYPSLSIDAEAGYENFNSKHLTENVYSTFYGVAAGLSAPLLNRKAIKADYFSANNKQIQAVYHYEQSLIKAYSEVINQLSMIKNFDTVYEMKSKQVEALNHAIEISNTLFKAARVDYIEALLTQRDALEAKLELVEAKKRQLTAYVDLYKALGGGWKGLKETTESNY